ncbi:MAG: hypothetical protein A3K10_13060 [Bacteroidetes bacterium RIFCSPLOWO2_12_FULL_31_6]|nr:MAG: hypothetical protein A3K10_13060 [Bacteroidetes bacterium RIFCSPLOWO2_12_FULL_31_6]
MKTKIVSNKIIQYSITLLVLLLFNLSSFGQFAYIDSIYVLPTNPTVNDNITIITETTFNEGCLSDTKQLFVDTFNHTIDISLFQCYGVWQAICNKTDTFTIGLLPIGTYTINFTLYSTGYDLVNGVCLQAYQLSDVDTASFIVNSITSIDKQVIENGVTIYPNPTKGKFTLQTEHSTKFEVMDIQGKQLFIAENKSKKNEIDLSNKPKGIYIVKITTAKEVVIEKIVLE